MDYFVTAQADIVEAKLRTNRLDKNGRAPVSIDFLGRGYDMFRASPFSAKGDTGRLQLKRSIFYTYLINFMSLYSVAFVHKH